MPLYEMTSDAFRPLSQASFADLKVREREDLQRLLRRQIDVLGDDLDVLTEEFGDWSDSRRRIDLLAIDTQANLVVIELKRTNDGGHMELQAIRYASMVSAMTFERAEQIHAEFLTRMGEPAEESTTRILAFLGWEEPGTLHANIKPSAHGWLGGRSGFRGLNFNYAIVQEYGVAELYIDRDNTVENKKIFDQIHARKGEIETAFGGKLLRERLETKRACRIKHIIERGGYRSSESEWPAIQSEMVEAMTSLETALKPELAALGL